LRILRVETTYHGKMSKWMDYVSNQIQTAHDSGANTSKVPPICINKIASSSHNNSSAVKAKKIYRKLTSVKKLFKTQMAIRCKPMLKAED